MRIKWDRILLIVGTSFGGDLRALQPFPFPQTNVSPRAEEEKTGAAFLALGECPSQEASLH